MELIDSNFLDTSTQLVVGSNTGTAENIIDPDKTFQYVTSGDNSDLTTSSITINFDETLTVGRIGILEMNWQDFTIFFNGATASQFSPTSTGSTITTDFSSNSETSMFIEVAEQACTSVTFDILSTQEANAEKAIGHIILSKNKLTFERTPPAKGYTPQLRPKQVVHRLSDGGTRLQTVAQKFRVDINYKHVTTEFRDNLRSVFDEKSEFIFVAFGTMASWDEVAFSASWEGPFDFYKFSDDSVDSGVGGRIRLRETPF